MLYSILNYVRVGLTRLKNSNNAHPRDVDQGMQIIKDIVRTLE
jgi:hypothetical protein